MTTPRILQEAEAIARSAGFDIRRMTEIQAGCPAIEPDVQTSSGLFFFGADVQGVRGVGPSAGSAYVILSRRAELETWAMKIEPRVAAIKDEKDERIRTLEERVAKLEEEVEWLQGESRAGEVIELRDISSEDAKQEILGLFSSGEILYMSEVAERLGLPDQQVVEICVALLKEGELKPRDDILRSR